MATMKDKWSIPLSGSYSDTSNTTAQENGGDGSFEAWFSDLNLQDRASVLITVSFSVATSAAVITSVLYDSWQWSKRRNDSKEKSLAFLIRIPPVHVLPLALAIASLIQGPVFLAVQSKGLYRSLFHDCRAVSQTTWSASWLSGYVLLVISMETVFRCLYPRNFRHINGNLRLWFRWSFISVMIVLTWLPSRIRMNHTDTCPAYLPYLINTWSDIGTVLAASFIFLFAMTVLVLKIQLPRTTVLCYDHRRAADDLIYYLAVITILFALTLPFWIQSAFFEPPHEKIKSMASLALSLFGVVNAALYVILHITRDNTLLCSGKSRCLARPDWRRLNSTELALARQISKPVDLERNNSAAQPLDTYSNGNDVPGAGGRPLPATPFPRQEARATPTNGVPPVSGRRSRLESLERRFPFPRQDRNRPHYSIFPAKRSSKPPLQHAVDSHKSHETEDLLRPPQPAFSGHRRYSSEISAATVQIGLRLSNIAMPAAAQHPSTQNLPLASATKEARLSDRSTNISSITGTPTLMEHDKVQIVPPPLMVPKRERVESPLRSAHRAGDEGYQRGTELSASMKRPWPLPDRLSLLPRKTYKQGGWI